MLLHAIRLVRHHVDKLKRAHKRSPAWSKVEHAYKASNPSCACCGSQKRLQVHHCKPFHLHPELELDPTNFITLCEAGTNGINCHLLVGHLGNFKSVNLSVAEDAASWNTKITGRPSDARLVE